MISEAAQQPQEIRLHTGPSVIVFGSNAGFPVALRSGFEFDAGIFWGKI